MYYLEKIMIGHIGDMKNFHYNGYWFGRTIQTQKYVTIAIKIVVHHNGHWAS